MLCFGSRLECCADVADNLKLAQFYGAWPDFKKAPTYLFVLDAYRRFQLALGLPLARWLSKPTALLSYHEEMWT
jgi:hypothetical protein